MVIGISGIPVLIAVILRRRHDIIMIHLGIMAGRVGIPLQLLLYLSVARVSLLPDSNSTPEWILSLKTRKSTMTVPFSS